MANFTTNPNAANNPSNLGNSSSNPSSNPINHSLPTFSNALKTISSLLQILPEDLTLNETKILMGTILYAKFSTRLLTSEERATITSFGYNVSAKNKSGYLFWNPEYIGYLTYTLKISKATLYRCLKSLAENGHIHPVSIPELNNTTNFNSSKEKGKIDWEAVMNRISAIDTEKNVASTAEKNTPSATQKNTLSANTSANPSVPQRRVMTSFEAQFAEYLDEAEKYVRELEEKESKESKENKASGESKENKVG